MHIPDGFVSGPINGAAAIASAATVGFAMWRAKRELAEKEFRVPLLATTAAFLFAAQMLNFPIGGGTSGHFLGAATAAALLGPWSACVVLALVLTTQGVLFGDGGVSALGTNILNMGIIGGILPYMIMRGTRALLPAGRGGYVVAAAAASWISVVLASSACALELAMSGTSPIGIALPAMAGTYAVIGIGEALICAAVLTAVAAARPDILPSWARVKQTESGHSLVRRSAWTLAAAGLVVAIALALFGSPFAAASPDGLEKVAEAKGFQQATPAGKTVWTKSLFPDYRVRGIKSEKVSTGLAGLAGTVLVFGLGFVAIRLVARAPDRRGVARGK